MINTLSLKQKLGFLSLSKINTIRKQYVHTGFFESIGSPRYISAPMVDQSSLPWRLLVKNNGADLAFSQMLHARNFVVDKNYRENCIEWEDYSHSSGNIDKESWAKSMDRPLIVQLAGDNPSVIVQAGCPQKIAKRGRYGAYLLKEKDLAINILETMVKELDCPITAKIRKLANDEDTIQLCQAIEAVGVQMLTVHGRTVEASKSFTGPADWEIIRKVKRAVSIPVVANGGIGNLDDANRCLAYTGADAVMSSEALLENPRMFSEDSQSRFENDYIRYQLETVREFQHYLQSYPQPRPLSQVVRSHLFKLLFRFLNAPKNLDFRDELSRCGFEDMLQLIDRIEDRVVSAVGYDVQRGMAEGFIGPTSWYMRHRDEKADSRIVTPPRHTRYKAMNASQVSKAVDMTSNEELQREKLMALKSRLLESRSVKVSATVDKTNRPRC